MQRGGIWTATLSVVHAGSHGSLAFDYAQRVAQKSSKNELRSQFFCYQIGMDFLSLNMSARHFPLNRFTYRLTGAQTGNAPKGGRSPTALVAL